MVIKLVVFDFDGVFTNGIQASYVELDPETGYVKL
jgi:3-deoxy-D-manno-octulosonate 8-phosphate phosphatase KdsC-like HAD superfamily phosphatase